MADVKGHRIGGYELIEKVGQGAMGIVYKARQISMDRIVALKVLSRKFSRDKEYIRRFVREARSAGKFSHHNIIHVHDVDVDNGIYFFSMELVEGQTLKEVLAERGPLPWKEATRYMVQMAGALAEADRHGIVHRDVKPANIMISARDNAAKLADLGIAKAADRPSLTQTNEVVGTPHYMAPEQGRGEDVDIRADIYALGATYYHLVTGKTAFDGTTAAELIRKHSEDDCPSPTEIHAKVPREVSAIVQKMMAKDPDDRYQTPEELEEDLKAVADGRAPAHAMKIPIMRTTGKASTARRRASRRRSKSSTGLVVGGVALLAAAILAIAVIALREDPGEKRAREAFDRARIARKDGRLEDEYRLLSEIPGQLDAALFDSAAANRIQEIKDILRDQQRHELIEEEHRQLVAWIEQHGNDLDGCRRHLENFIRNYGDHPTAEDARVRLAAIKEACRRQLFSVLETARRLEQEERFGAALDHLNRFAETRPRWPETKRAQERARELTAAATAACNDRIAEAGRLADDGSFEEAEKKIELIIQRYDLPDLVERARKELAALRKRAGTAMAGDIKEELARARKVMRTFKITEASTIIEDAGKRAATAELEDEVMEMQRLLSAINHVYDSMTIRLRDAARPIDADEVGIEPPGKISRASEKGIRIVTADGAVDLAWKEIPAGRIVTLARWCIKESQAGDLYALAVLAIELGQSEPAREALYDARKICIAAEDDTGQIDALLKTLGPAPDLTASLEEVERLLDDGSPVEAKEVFRRTAKRVLREGRSLEFRQRIEDLWRRIKRAG